MSKAGYIVTFISASIIVSSFYLLYIYNNPQKDPAPKSQEQIIQSYQVDFGIKKSGV